LREALGGPNGWAEYGAVTLAIIFVFSWSVSVDINASRTSALVTLVN